MKFLTKMKQMFVDSIKRRSKVLSDLQTLDEIKEMINIASALSLYSEQQNMKLEGMGSHQQKDALIDIDSLFFENAHESFLSMPIEAQKQIIVYSHAHQKYKPKKEDIDSLAISGGGGKGQFYAGALKELEEIGILKNIKTFSGASAGALTAIPLALGCDAQEMSDIVEFEDFRALMIEGNEYNTDKKGKKKFVHAFENITNNDSNEFNEKSKIRDREIEIDIEKATELKGSKLNNLEIGNIIIQVKKDIESGKFDGEIKSKVQSMDKLSEDDKVHNMMNLVKRISQTLSPVPIEDKIYTISDNQEPPFISSWDGEYLTKYQCLDLNPPIHLPDGIHQLNMDSLKNQVWSQKGASEQYAKEMTMYNNMVGFDYFKDPKEFFDLTSSFILDNDYVETYFGNLITQKIESLHAAHGSAFMESISKGLSQKRHWKNISLAQLGKIAKTKEGQEMGFRDLAIAVTKTTIKTRKEEPYALSTKEKLARATGIPFVSRKIAKAVDTAKQVLNTESIIVSSDMDKTESNDLSNIPIVSLARMSMSIPIIFNPKEHNGEYYVDGGLHNNLPTAYFDKDGKSKNTLSLVLLTSGEIEASKSIQDAFNNTAPMNLNHAIKNSSTIKETVVSIWDKVKSKTLSIAINKMTYPNNNAYKDMGIKESFRNILVNTKSYGTMDFRASPEDFKIINEISQETVSGVDANGLKTCAGLFDSNYNSMVRFYEYAASEHGERNPERFEAAQFLHNERKQEAKSGSPFIHSKSINAMKSFIEKTQKSHHMSEDLTTCNKPDII